MDKYDDLAARHGVKLAPFTTGYLDLYGSKGVKVLEKFIMTNLKGRRSQGIEDFQYPLCICPVCQMFDERYIGDNNVYIGAYRKIHTVYHRILLYETVNSICDDASDLISIEPQSRPYINYIDELLDGDVKQQGKLECF